MTIGSSVSQPSCVNEVERVQASGSGFKALIFDVDGTLYDQAPVRRAMLYRLLRAHLGCPLQGLLTLRVLDAYRQAQEVLRKTSPASGDIADAQLLLAGRSLGMSAETIAPYVARWIEDEPLPLVASSLRKGILELLRQAKRFGLRLAVCSDYPADRKLRAMSIAQYFDVVVTAQDPEVQRFKPDPTGLEVTLHRLAVRKDEAVYIGDRTDVDAVAASRAGIQSFILNGMHSLSELSRLVIPQG